MARGVFLKKNGERYYPAPYMPIGSIYLTVSNDNPSRWFGGTWEKMSGGYLYACVNSIGNSSYTGSSTQPHTLTVNQIPSHRHIGLSWLGDDIYQSITLNPGSSGTGYNISYTGGYVPGQQANIQTRATGGGQAHSHNIAYIGVWCWKRIA